MTLKRLPSMLAMLVVAGCSSTTPGWDQQFGDSVRAVRARQVIDPEAAARTQQAQGVDGKAVVGALKTYAESYGYAVREPRPAALVIPSTMTGGR